MKKILLKTGKILNIILIVILGCTVISNIYIFAARKITGSMQPTIFGFSHAVVISGSMEPAISVNDLIITRARREYEAGDVIMFESGSNLVTHRIVEVTPNGYVTKGDANNAPDPTPPVEYEKVVGRVAAVIPGIGAVIGFLQTPLGLMLIAVSLFALIALFSFSPLKKENEVADDEKDSSNKT